MAKDIVELGKLVATRGVWELIDKNERFSAFVTKCLTRYMTRDWGDVKNDELIGAYLIPEDIDGVYESHLWVQTNEEQTETTLFFPGDF